MIASVFEFYHVLGALAGQISTFKSQLTFKVFLLTA